MKKQYVSLLFVILSTCTFLFSCGNKMNKNMGDLLFDSICVNETAYLFADTSKPACNVIINFSYPSQSSDELLSDSLDYYFIKVCFGERYAQFTVEEAIKQYVNNYIKDYRKDLEPLYRQDEKDQPEGSAISSWYSYYKNIESNVQTYEKGLLVYRSHYDEYTGGAHGMYMTNFMNIDLALMRPLYLDDIFVGEYQEAITDLIWNQLMAEHKAKTREELENMGYGSTGEIGPIENFYLSDKGITFYYNVYDITPYAMGPVSVSLPYTMIDHWLSTNPVVHALKR